MNFIFKLFGWLFSNLFIILLVVIASYAVIYWDDPFGDETPAGKVMAMFPDETDMVRGWVAALDPTHVEGEDAAEADDASDALSVAYTEGNNGASSDGGEHAASTAADAVGADGAASDAYVTPEIEQALSELSSDGSVEDMQKMQQVDDSGRGLMIDARRAYLKRDYEASIAAYESLIGSDKDNYDALGELGNVHFNQGEMEKAADAYYEAATIMVSQGHLHRAGSLIGFLRSVDESKAESLRALIDEQREQPL